jgi:3-isopropylmalate/(R)-2-methylmalate dehydratase small subunit
MELSIAEAAKYTMSAIDTRFAAQVQQGDIMVAGTNFGSGSSRETSPLTLRYLGVGAIGTASIVTAIAVVSCFLIIRPPMSADCNKKECFLCSITLACPKSNCTV